MRHLSRLIIMWIVLIFSAQASAIDVDKFACEAFLTSREDGKTVQMNWESIGVREPVAPDPNWIEGVSATKTQLKMIMEDEAGTIYMPVTYTLFSSREKNKAAQNSCISITYRPKDGPSRGTFCMADSGPITGDPIDPTDHFPSTVFYPDTDKPLPRSEDFALKRTTLPEPSKWSEVSFICRYQESLIVPKSGS